LFRAWTLSRIRWVFEEDTFIADWSVERAECHHVIRKGQDLSVMAASNCDIDIQLDPPDSRLLYHLDSSYAFHSESHRIRVVWR